MAHRNKRIKKSSSTKAFRFINKQLKLVDMTKIDIDDDKYEVIEVRAKEKGFENTEKYIDHLMSQIVDKIKKETEEKEYSEEEEEEVKKKLKDLGYM